LFGFILLSNSISHTCLNFEQVEAANPTESKAPNKTAITKALSFCNLSQNGFRANE